jgi:hypothetical protein
MRTTDPGDAARIELLLAELRLPDRHSVRDCGAGGLCAGSTMSMLTIGNFCDITRNRSE